MTLQQILSIVQDFQQKNFLPNFSISISVFPEGVSEYGFISVRASYYKSAESNGVRLGSTLTRHLYADEKMNWTGDTWENRLAELQEFINEHK